MEDSNWQRCQEELDSLRAIYSDEGQLNCSSDKTLGDETLRFSLQLKSNAGHKFTLRYELPPTYPCKAKPTVWIDLQDVGTTSKQQAELQKELSSFLAVQPLDEELLFSVASFCESELAVDSVLRTTVSVKSKELSVDKNRDVKKFEIDVHTFDGHFSASKATCTLTIVGESGAKSGALVLPTPLKRGKTVSIYTMLDANLLPISHVELANPSSDCWRPQWVRIRACGEDMKIHSMQWVQKGRTQNAFVNSSFGLNR